MNSLRLVLIRSLCRHSKLGFSLAAWPAVLHTTILLRRPTSHKQALKRRVLCQISIRLGRADESLRGLIATHSNVRYVHSFYSRADSGLVLNRTIHQTPTAWTKLLHSRNPPLQNFCFVLRCLLNTVADHAGNKPFHKFSDLEEVYKAFFQSTPSMAKIRTQQG